jgi:hypothetical protein
LRGAEKSPHTSKLCPIHRGFCGLFPAKINRERISKEQGNRFE